RCPGRPEFGWRPIYEMLMPTASWRRSWRTTVSGTRPAQDRHHIWRCLPDSLSNWASLCLAYWLNRPPGTPVHVVIRLSCHLLLVRKVFLEHVLALAAVRSLIANIKAAANRRVCVDLDQFVVTHLEDEFMRRQGRQRGLTLRCVRRRKLEPRSDEQIFFVLHALRRAGACRQHDAG